MRERRKHNLEKQLTGSLLPLFLSLVLLAPASAAQGNPIQVCKHNPVGFRAPKIKTPQDAANALGERAVFAPWWIYRNTISPLFTALKYVGLRGWTDYCSEACATGTVVHAVNGIDGFYTVDLALTEFEVNGESTRLGGPRFVRIEMYGKARKQTHPPPRKGDTVHICGKLMWDGDGFLEVHPRSPADVRILASKPKQDLAAAPSGRADSLKATPSSSEERDP